MLEVEEVITFLFTSPEVARAPSALPATYHGEVELVFMRHVCLHMQTPAHVGIVYKSKLENDVSLKFLYPQTFLNAINSQLYL